MISIDTTKLRCCSTNTTEVEEGIFAHFLGSSRRYSYLCRVFGMDVLHAREPLLPFLETC